MVFIEGDDLKCKRYVYFSCVGNVCLKEHIKIDDEDNNCAYFRAIKHDCTDDKKMSKNF